MMITNLSALRPRIGFVALLVFGCSSATSDDNDGMGARMPPDAVGPVDGGQVTDAGLSLDAVTSADSGVQPDSGPQPDTGIPVAFPLGPRCTGSMFDSCETTVELPRSVDTIIEYLDPNSEVPGRCDGTDLDPEPAILLPDDPAAYPVLVRVAGAGFEGECSSCIQSRPPYGLTQYGVAIEVPHELVSGRAGEITVTASVNHPWRIVSGGCGEACAHNCLSEYLEFPPSTCLSSHGSGLGVATDVEDPPVAEVVVQLVSPRNVALCCHLACEQDK